MSSAPKKAKAFRPKPKIAILIPRYGLVERGAENFTKDFVRYLHNDFEITIFSRHNIHCVSSENAIVQRIYHAHRWLARLLDTLFLSPDEIEMLTFSLCVFPYVLFGTYDVLFPQNGVWGALTCRLIRLFKGMPFIYRSAGGNEPWIVRQKPNCYIATTPETLRFIKSYRNDIYTRLVPNGVDGGKFSVRVKPVSVKLEQPVYLCVGALIRAKQIGFTIQAVAALPKGSLLLIGDGPLKKEYEKMGNELLGPKRFLLTNVPHDSMPSYYRAAKVFTLPAPCEPFGIVYIEAMACGVPVVTQDEESKKFIVGNAGVFCRTSNISEYAHALAEAAATKFGNKPIAQSKRFDWKRISGAYIRLLEELIHENQKA